MNKLFTKAIGVALGLTMAIGVGVAVAGQQKGFREVKATTATISYSDITGMTSTAGEQTGTASGFTFYVENGLVNGHLRVYKSKYLEITAPANNLMTQVVFNCIASGTAQYGPGCFVKDGSTSGAYTYSGTAGTWAFANGASSIKLIASSNQVRITSFEITYSAVTTPSITLTPSSLTFVESGAAQAVTVTKNSAFTANPTLSVAATPSYVNVSFDGLTINVSPKAVGTEQITINAINGSENASATLSVSVLTDHGHLPNDPYSVADARTAIDGGISSSEKVYVTGIVSKVDSFSSGSITYWISDDGTTTNQFEIYNGKNLNNTNFSAQTDVEVGATVVNYGGITKYNSTYEFGSGSYLSSYTAPVKTLTSIAVSNAKTEYEVGDEFVKPTVTASYNIGNDEDVTDSATFTGYNLSVVGDYTVTVSYTEGGVTKTAEYDITVTAPITKYTVTFLAGEGSGSMDPVQVNENTLYTLPACTFTAPAGKQFRGWTLNGTDIVTEITVTGAVSVTALWEVIPTVDYKKVKTNLANFSGDYLIVYEAETNYAFDGSLETLDASSNTVEVTISDELINLAETSEFHVAAKEGGYSIKSASSLYIGKTADSNGIDSKATDTYTNTISYADDVMNIVGSGNAVMRYNKASGQERFRFFKTSTYSAQEEISLYMQVTDAEALALDILNETAETCDAWTQETDASGYAARKTALATIWSNLKTKYSSVDMDDLKDVVAKKDGVMVEEAMARYELLTAKYELENFISSRTPHANSFSQSFEANNDTIMIIVVVIAAMSALSMVAFLTIKRRKHN